MAGSRGACGSQYVLEDEMNVRMIFASEECVFVGTFESTGGNVSENGEVFGASIIQETRAMQRVRSLRIGGCTSGGQGGHFRYIMDSSRFS